MTEVDIARKRIGLSLKSVVEIDRRSPAERVAEKANQQNRGPRPQHGGNFNRNAPRDGAPNRGNNRGNQSFGGLGDVLGKLGL